MPVDDATLKALDETGAKMDAMTGGEAGGGLPGMGGDKPADKPADKPKEKAAKSSGDPDLDMAIDSTGYDAVVVNCLKRVGAKLDDKGKAIMKKELGGKSDPGMMGFIGDNGGYKDEDFEDVKMGDEEPSGENANPFA